MNPSGSDVAYSNIENETKGRTGTCSICGSSSENLFSTLWYSMEALSSSIFGFRMCCRIRLFVTFFVQTTPHTIDDWERDPPGIYSKTSDDK